MLAALVLFPALILGDQWHSRRSSTCATTPPASPPSASLALGDLGRPGRRLPPLADPPAAGDRRRAPLPSPAARRRRHGEPARPAVPRDRRRSPRHSGRNLASGRGISGGGVGAGGPRTDAARPPAGPPATASGPPANSPSSGSPRSWPPSSSSTPSRRCTRRTSPKASRTPASSSSPSPSSTPCCATSSGTGGCSSCVLWVVGARGGRLRRWSGRSSTLTRSLFWNDQVIRSNEFHTYFRVNSVFWDPNVYGRCLALAIVVAMAALLWARERRDPGAADGAGRGPLDRPGADLLAVELHRPARRPRGARRPALEPALDAGRGRRRRRRGGPRRPPRRRLLGEQLSRINIDTPAAPTSSPAASTSSPSARSTATARAPSRAPTANTSTPTRCPVSISHTEPITVAAEQGVVGLAAYARPAGHGAMDDGRRRLAAVSGRYGPRSRRPAGSTAAGEAAPCSPRSSPCWCTRWRMPGSSRTP